jgi:hypothetical protein
MLSVNPKNRPTISSILEKPFIKKKVAGYIYDLIQSRPESKIEDFQCEILKEQAEKLGVYNIIIKELSSDNIFEIKQTENEYENFNLGYYSSLIKNKKDKLKKIEEKIIELEKQKRILSKNNQGKLVYRKNDHSSVDKLKNKDTTRKNSTGKTSRKISHESAVNMNDSRDISIIEKNIHKNKYIARPTSGLINSKISQKKEESKLEDSLDEIIEVKDDLDIESKLSNLGLENLSDKNKLLKITQEISKMKGLLEQTQNQILQIEGKIKQDKKNVSEEENFKSQINDDNNYCIILPKPIIVDNTPILIERINFFRQ